MSTRPAVLSVALALVAVLAGCGGGSKKNAETPEQKVSDNRSYYTGGYANGSLLRLFGDHNEDGSPRDWDCHQGGVTATQINFTCRTVPDTDGTFYTFAMDADGKFVSIDPEPFCADAEQCGGDSSSSDTATDPASLCAGQFDTHPAITEVVRKLRLYSQPDSGGSIEATIGTGTGQCIVVIVGRPPAGQEVALVFNRDPDSSSFTSETEGSTTPDEALARLAGLDQHDASVENTGEIAP